MIRPTINSEKHYRQVPVFTVTQTNIANSGAVSVGHSPDGNIATEVRVGAVVKAVYVEYWIIAEAMATCSFTIAVEKIVGDGDSMTALQGADLNAYPNKKNVLYVTQGIVGDQNTNTVPVIRQWIKIPKGKQRFGLGDTLVVNFLANVSDMQVCGLVVFKEYY